MEQRISKLTANAFLAQRISSINSISAICEATGADVREVSRAIGSDSGIGSKFLDSSPGFGGSCFKKDILNLVYLAKYFGLSEVAKFWNEVVELNNWHQHRISRLITSKLFGTLSRKKIVVLGFAFKANTNDTRESAAITICNDLLEEGAVLSIHDPKVSLEQIKNDLNLNNFTDQNKNKNFINSFHEGNWSKEENLNLIFDDCDAVVLLTEWQEYSNLDWNFISKRMRQPAWVFDSRSILNPSQVLKAGINYWRIGDGSK